MIYAHQDRASARARASTIRAALMLLGQHGTKSVTIRNLSIEDFVMYAFVTGTTRFSVGEYAKEGDLFLQTWGGQRVRFQGAPQYPMIDVNIHTDEVPPFPERLPEEVHGGFGFCPDCGELVATFSNSRAAVAEEMTMYGILLS